MNKKIEKGKNMAETRYCELYKDGKLISKTPYTVSDKQLAIENNLELLKTLVSKSDLTAAEVKQAIILMLKLFKRFVLNDES